MLNSKQIMKITGIGSMKTLTRWHQQGLIPPPEIKTHPNGRGKMAYWPNWVERRIAEVKQLLNKGQTLEEIEKQLGTDWEAEAKRLAQRRYSFRKAMENDRRRKAHDSYTEAIEVKVYGFLRSMGLQRPGGFSKVARQFGSLKHINQVLKLAREGYNPVAVIDGGTVKVTADFLISDLLNSASPGNQPILVVPLHRELLDAYAEVESELTLEPKYKPARTILVQDRGKLSERNYEVDSSWRIKVSK